MNPSCRSTIVAVCLSAIAFSPVAAAQTQFNIEFDASAAGLTITERTNIELHLREAGRRWVRAIGMTAPRSIELRVGIGSMPTANAGSTTTAFVGVIDGRNTYEQGVAHELRTGIDPNGAEPDGLVNIGLNYLRNELWFDPDPQQRLAPVPVDRTDALSVMLHEIGHAIAYNGWANLSTGVPPDTYWSTFDRWMLPGKPTVITGPSSVQAWGLPPEVTTGNNKHWGNAASTSHTHDRTKPAPVVQWRNGAPIPTLVCDLPMSIDAPRSREDAEDSNAGATLLDELMNGVVFYRGTRYDISPLDRGLMMDVGALNDPIFVAGFESTP